jgi:glycosyltransferase involved in cell wall biosynthesis
MKCPNINDLCPAPAGKSGWPWTEQASETPPTMNDGSPWPMISVVTPNYNYARYLETTIRSVLLQGYPNVEYIVQDDGSTDDSVAVIKKYEPHLAYWSTEPNAGQVAAINRGLRRARGSILCYINSDDYYLPGAFKAAAEFLHANPSVDMVNGRCRFVDQDEREIGRHFGAITRLDEVLDLWGVWWANRQFVQPETFWRRRMYETVGEFRNDLYIVFDYEYWVRALAAGAVIRPLDFETAAFRFQPAQKTSQGARVAQEELRVVNEWIWDPRVPLSNGSRARLQGKWLYDAVFRRVADRAVADGESRLRRWVSLAGLTLRFPQILYARPFWERLRTMCTSHNTGPAE